MVKFVAALFLPMFLGLASLLVRDYRTRFVRDWRLWLQASVIALALIAPGTRTRRSSSAGFWRGHLRRARLHALHDLSRSGARAPVELLLHGAVNRWLALSGALWLTILGALIFVVDAIRRRWAEALVIVLWFAVPMVLISFGTSKLYHYTYPFLPPVALAGGYAAGFLWVTVRPLVEARYAPGRRFIEFALPAS